jgi:hypothetical protein
MGMGRHRRSQKAEGDCLLRSSHDWGDNALFGFIDSFDIEGRAKAIIT